MISIDKYAYSSKLKEKDPKEKLVFALLTLGVCLWVNSMPTSIVVFLIMGGITVYKGGIPFGFYLKLLTMPMSFLIIGVLTIAINVSADPEIFLVSLNILGNNVGISTEGVRNGIGLFLKSMGAVSCLYYLSLSTPIVDLLAVLRKLKVPKLLIEMMSLIYRFIFVLLETADTMFTAQNSRLGYSSLSSGYRSLGALASTLFIRAYKRSDDIYTALESRGYDGDLNVLEEQFATHWTNYIAPVLMNVLLILTALFLKRFTGGIIIQ